MNSNEPVLPGMEQPRQAMSLLQYTTWLGNAIRRAPELYGCWIVAELSDVRMSGGHCYMELIEKNAAGATVAKIRANIWRGTLEPVRRRFLQATGRDIATGLKVMLTGQPNHHPQYGLSFNITDIDPSYTMGDLERLRREILQTLSREGVAGFNRSLPFPTAPQRIAVISAAGAAGYGDFINQLNSTPEGFRFYPALFSAVLQGERTAGSVTAALDRIEQTIDCWDCVVIIRGGGSTTDLNGFDNLQLARRVATFPIPVVVGIGHERDRTVLDEIANTRCKTPTAVAAFLIDSLRQAWRRADELTRFVVAQSRARLEGEMRRMAQAAVAIPSVARNGLDRARMRMEHIAQAIPMATRRLTDGTRLRLDSLSTRIADAAGAISDREHRRLDSLASLVEVLSPDNTLRRGYSITRVDGHAVKDPALLAEGTVIETRLLKGSVRSVVKK